MTAKAHIEEILKLSVEERILAVQKIWDSIEDEKLNSISSEQVHLLEERWEAYKNNPSMALSWEEAKKKIAEARKK